MSDELQNALAYHQRGLLAQAARIYGALLASNPQHADALHLLGVVALQQGDARQAIELISRAVACNCNVAAFHANLAEAYRAEGDYERAAECCRSALRLDPTCAEAANNLGLALMGLGQTQAAVAQFRATLQLSPDFAMAENNLGNALRSAGDVAQALAHFRRAVQLDPQMVEARSNLGQLLLEQNQPQEALAHCREAVRLRPEFAEAQNNLGNVLRDLGRLSEAKACYAEALRLNPRLALAHNNMGQALQEEGHLQEALTWYQRSLQLDANSARVLCNLGSALEELDETDEAVRCYERAMQLAPDYAEAYSGLGWVKHEEGHYDEAQSLYRRAIDLQPNLAAAHCNLGTLLEELSDFDGAERSFREALQHNPRHAAARAQLSTLRRSKLSEADLAALRQLLADPDLSDAKRASLHFALAQVLDARQVYEEAAEHLHHANALALAEWHKRGQGYDPAAHSQFVAAMMATCTPAFFERVRGFGLDTERPIFIVGLPRSGTTLTEQILASHSQVFGAGELRLAREEFEAIPGARDSGSGVLEGLRQLDRPTACRLAQQHLDRLRALDASSLRVADKMPDNYLYLGLLATLFPKAKFIHCRRDLRDVAISCWMTNFRQIRWASDPEHVALRFQEYERLMEHWRQVLPVPLLEVSYEETVADLEGVARRLVAWCGLEWEPACLSFHEGKRPVRTASVTQVRQPVYTKSVARWKHYERPLAPLLSRLACAPASG